MFDFPMYAKVISSPPQQREGSADKLLCREVKHFVTHLFKYLKIIIPVTTYRNSDKFVTNLFKYLKLILTTHRHPDN